MGLKLIFESFCQLLKKLNEQMIGNLVMICCDIILNRQLSKRGEGKI